MVAQIIGNSQTQNVVWGVMDGYWIWVVSAAVAIFVVLLFVVGVW